METNVATFWHGQTETLPVTKQKKFSPAYYARQKYAGTIIVNWDKINC